MKRYLSFYLVFVLFFCQYSSSLFAANPSRVISPSVYIQAIAENDTTNVSNVQLQTEEADLSQNADYRAICQFIARYYKRVQPENIRLIAQHIVYESMYHQIDPMLITALISHESSFNHLAVSKSGAKGLGQMMPCNFKRYSITDPFDIAQNVSATAQFLRRLIDLWDHRRDDSIQLALASYYRGYNHIKRENGQLTPRSNFYVNQVMAKFEIINKIKQELSSDIVVSSV